MFIKAAISPFVTVPLTAIAGGLAFVRYYNPNKSISKFEETEKLLLEKHVKKANIIKKQVFIDNGVYINTLKVEQPNSKDKPTIVLVHGWGSGLPLWSKNLDKLSEFGNIYAVDLLGFGLSSRPEFKGESAEDAKRFWVDSLSKWKKTEIPDEKVIIVGHSLGGYITCAYSLENPGEVEKLILAAPVGIAPWLWSKNASQSSSSTLFRKVVKELIWTYNFSPQSILRTTGYYSKSIWDSIGEGSRYRELDKDCWDYLYHAQIHDPSGDVAFLKLLSPDGWTHPLYDDLHKLEVPMRIIYGERDYVPYADGPKIISRVKTPSDYVVLPNVGHHLYWNRDHDFVDAIKSFVIPNVE